MPKAASLAEELRQSVGVEAQLVAGGGGVFDVFVDGDLVYSKAQTGRFPDPGEVSQILDQS